MRRLFALGLVGLTGCANCAANFCDTFFKARNVCRDQEAAAVASVPVAQPVIVASPMVTCSTITCADMTCSAPIICSGAVLSSSMASPVGGEVEMAPVYSNGVVIGEDAGAVETVSESNGHPMFKPFRFLSKHHRENRE